MLRSTVVAADRPHSFSFVADALGLHAERTFTIRPTPDGLSSIVISYETQVGPLARLGWVFLTRWLRAANQTMFDDLARAVVRAPAAQTTRSDSVSPRTHPSATSATRNSWT